MTRAGSDAPQPGGPETSWLGDGALEWHGRPVARTVADAGARCRAVVRGVVREVVVHPARTVRGPTGRVVRGPAFDASLDDGSGTIVVRWTGRAAVPGVVPGALLCVEGTVCDLHGRLGLLNPLYRFDQAASSTVDQTGSSTS